MSILIKDVLLNEKVTSIYIEENKIADIGKKPEADRVIDAKGKAAVPSFFNSHTHAAMTLMRGYADDLPLHKWLNEHIWPLEAKLTEDDVYWGTRLACLEMIKSGTTFFNDMYWHFMGSARAVHDAGIRAALSAVFIDFGNDDEAKKQIKLNKKLFEESKKLNNRIRFALGPHAIYSVSQESLQWAREFADKNKAMIHIHVSETRKEADDCVKKHKMRPVEYLDKIGFLGDNVLAAHCVWLNDKEISLLAKNNVKVSYDPISNTKLAVGKDFEYRKMRKAGVAVCLGTDGCASNNSLDMFEVMKFASLLQKQAAKDETMLPAKEVFELATLHGAKAFGINAGEIKKGKLADLLLIDLKMPRMTPHYNLISNIVYAANGSCVDTTICDGKILMENKKVEGEEKVLEKVQKTADGLVSR